MVAESVGVHGWTDPETGETRTELFDKKADAERHESNMKAGISRGQYIDPRAGNITVKEYAEFCGTSSFNTYLHEWPEAVDRTRSLVDHTLARPAEPMAA